MRKTVLQRLFDQCEFADNGCWIWTGRRPKGDYGQIWYEGRAQVTHRVAYKIIVDPIPEGYQLDHVKLRGCLSRACFNPDHLEPVTCKENIARGSGFTAEIARSGLCKRGHLLEETGKIYFWKGKLQGRFCSVCRKINQYIWYEKCKMTTIEL